MSRSNESWGSAPKVAQKPKTSKSAKSAIGMWSMDRLTPKETTKTQVNKFSYTGMTIIHRNGKK